MATELERLVKWCCEQCNGDWEHGNGIKLVTIDNPGWSLDVTLTGTQIAGKSAAPMRIERSEDDWIFYEVSVDVFRGRCGPANLTEMLDIFLTFAGAIHA